MKNKAETYIIYTLIKQTHTNACFLHTHTHTHTHTHKHSSLISTLTPTPTQTLYNTQTNMSTYKQSYTLTYIRREGERERDGGFKHHLVKSKLKLIFQNVFFSVKGTLNCLGNNNLSFTNTFNLDTCTFV